MEIIKQVAAYRPYNQQEENDKIEILKQLQMQKDIFSRDNRIAHMTASAWVVNHDQTKVLMIYHNIYNSWSWLGGHADGDCHLLEDAILASTEPWFQQRIYNKLNEKLTKNKYGG